MEGLGVFLPMLIFGEGKLAGSFLSCFGRNELHKMLAKAWLRKERPRHFMDPLK